MLPFKIKNEKIKPKHNEMPSIAPISISSNVLINEILYNNILFDFIAADFIDDFGL